MSEAAPGPRQSLSDFLQRRSLSDARSSVFHSFNRRQSRAGAHLADARGQGFRHSAHVSHNVMHSAMQM